MLSAIDRQSDACDAPCLRKVEHSGCDDVRPRPALKRQTLRLCGELDIGLARTGQRWPWGNCVDAEFRSQCLRQRGGGGVQGALAQSVREKAWIWLEHTLVENIYNRGHDACRSLGGEGLRQKQRSREIYSNGVLETCMRERFDVVGLKLAGVVDKECQLTKRGRGRNEPTHCLVVGKIAKHDACTAACSRNRGRKSFGILARMICV